MHENYPELVKTMLLSDTYWQLNSIGAQSEEGIQIHETPFGLSAQRLYFNKDLIHGLTSSVTATRPGDDSMELPFGSTLPTTSERQYLKLVIDEKTTFPKLSIPGLFHAIQHRHRERSIQSRSPEDIAHYSFKGQLKDIHETNRPDYGMAYVAASASLFRFARCSRSVLYAKTIPNDNRLLAMSANSIRYVEELMHKEDYDVPSEPLGEPMFPHKVGEVFVEEFKSMVQARRIVEAHLVEPSGVFWKTRRGNSRPQNDEKKLGLADRFMPGLSRAS